MIIHIPDSSTTYYYSPFTLKKDAKVEAVQVTSMNTNLNRNTSSNNLNNHKSEGGFEEILQTEIKKYR